MRIRTRATSQATLHSQPTTRPHHGPTMAPFLENVGWWAKRLTMAGFASPEGKRRRERDDMENIAKRTRLISKTSNHHLDVDFDPTR